MLTYNDHAMRFQNQGDGFWNQTHGLLFLYYQFVEGPDIILSREGRPIADLDIDLP